MSTQNLIAGLQLTQLYRYKNDTNETRANDGVIFINATHKQLSKEHINNMIELGFCQEHSRLGSNKSFTVDDYRWDIAWRFYT